MNVLYLLIASAAILYLASRLYGRLVARWLGEQKGRPTPAETMADGRDYVPTKLNVVFGHHFATIAGAGPILGPTLAVIYGYLPVWLWVLVGGVLIGAVHDFSTLFISLRERGRSMAEIARSTLGDRGFALFIGFAIAMIILVTAAFLRLTAISLTSMVVPQALHLPPDQHWLRTVQVMDPNTGQVVTKAVIGGIASTSVIIITACAPLIGWLLYRRRIATWLGYLLAALVCLVSLYVGFRFPVSLSAPEQWMGIIAVYVLLAAAIPVWLVLQPRDFTNVQILYVGIVVMVVGLFVGGGQGMTVAMQPLSLGEGVSRLGMVWPMLFITVACGAISGFHALAASGTTAKQVAKEEHARVIGFNGMLLESLLAIAVLLVVAGALPRQDYLGIVWPASKEVVSNPILAFSLALGNMLHQTLRAPAALGAVFGILLVEGFVVTTLDTAVRLNRYLFEELWGIFWKGGAPAILRLPWFNSALSVVLMLLLAWKNGVAYIWPLFGTGNQMLAALSLTAVSAWLLTRRRQAWFTILPAIFMMVTTLASLLILLRGYWAKLLPALATGFAGLFGAEAFGTMLLAAVDVIMLVLSVGVIILAVKLLATMKRTPVPAEAPRAR